MEWKRDVAERGQRWMRDMRKAFLLGILASCFFAFTFILNRSMNLTGGYWGWSASLRYFFMLPILAVIVWRQKGMAQILREIKDHLPVWLLWSTVGFGLFYAPLTLGSVYGESWMAAASWQITIVAGVLLTPLFGRPVPRKNLCMSMIILAGVFLIQVRPGTGIDLGQMVHILLPVIVAAFCYPLGNRKMMAACPEQINTMQRVFGMTLCSIPFWIVLSGWSVVRSGLPGIGQVLQSACVAVFSGVVATLLFFRATDLVKESPGKLAIVEATQSFEVLFTLLGGILFLGDAAPGAVGMAGIGLIVVGMICNNL